MLGDLHDLALGPVSPALALLFATLGCLLGIILAARARRATAWRRARFVAYATVSVGVIGIWQPAVIGVLGLRVDGSVLRLDEPTLWASLLVALGTTATAMVLLCLCRDRVGVLRMLGGVVLLAVGVLGTGLLVLQSLRTGGEIGYRSVGAGVAVGIAIAAGSMLAWSLGATPTLRWAAGSALGLGCALTALHLVASATLWVRPGRAGPIDADVVPGVAPMGVVLPSVVLAGVLMALMWYFSAGTATLRDLRLIFEQTGDAEQIEPWVIEQVQARVAMSSTAFNPVGEAPWAGNVWAEATVAVRALPLLGGEVASALARARTNRRGRGAPPAPAIAPTSPAVAPISPAVAPTSPATAPTSPAAAPVWRPIPGWGIPAAVRSMLTPPPLTPPMYPADAIRPEPARRRGRPVPSWDELATNPQGWIRVGETNEHRVVTGGHPTNSRLAPAAQRTAAEEPELVRSGGTQGSDVRRGPSTPLPRRNARS